MHFLVDFEQVNVTTTPPRNPNRGSRGFTKQAADVLSAYITMGCYPTIASARADANPFGIEIFIHGNRCTDDGSSATPWMHIRAPLKSVKDYPHIKLSINYDLDKKVNTKTLAGDGSSVITFACPAASFSSIQSWKRYVAAAHLNDEAANTTNTNWESTHANRSTVHQDALVKANGNDDGNPTVMEHDFVLPTDKMTNKPYRCHNRCWQGDTFAQQPRGDKTMLKKLHQSVPFDETSSCGTLECKGRHFWVYWEIPLLGDQAGKFIETPAKGTKKTGDEMDKEIDALLGL